VFAWICELEENKRKQLCFIYFNRAVQNGLRAQVRRACPEKVKLLDILEML
jgi:hypothetical protein